MPNRAGAALRRSRGKKVVETPVDETPTTEYSSEESNTTATSDNTETDGTEMSNEDWDYDGGEGGSIVTLERDDDATENENENALPDFAAMVEDAPADYTPQRNSAGRKREPSPFDGIVTAAKGQGWKRVPYQGEEQAKLIKRQLQKAQHFADLGMDLNTTATHVEFNVREKQPRTRKAEGGGGNGQVALDTANADVEQDASDRDE